MLRIAYSAVLCIAGCQSESRHSALESQLRDHEATIRELQADVEQAETLLAEQDRELRVARTSATKSRSGNIIAAGKTSAVPFASEAELAWGSVRSLQLHQLTSGLLPSAEKGGSELNLIWQPLDEDGEVVKVAGDLEVHASTVGADGVTQEIATREYSITDSRLLWSRGLVSSGFHVTLPIPTPPTTTDHVLVSAVLNLGPDRNYKASAVIRMD